MLFFCNISDVPDSGLPLFNFTCGVTAGMMASMVTQPADVVKTHMQLYPKRYRKIRNAVIYVYQVRLNCVNPAVQSVCYMLTSLPHSSIPDLFMIKLYHAGTQAGLLTTLTDNTFKNIVG